LFKLIKNWVIHLGIFVLNMCTVYRQVTVYGTNTVHFVFYILQNEMRKAKKLEELMEELSLVPSGETLEVPVPPFINSTGTDTIS
jgi:hypothetical protein